MAKQTTVTLVDDMDGSKADETVRFALDGVEYEIDLSKKNAKALRAALERYVSAGRRLSKARGASRRHAGNSDAEAIRAWARASDVTVSDRGRISAEVRRAFEAAR
jgi:hypothetical protein